MFTIYNNGSVTFRSTADNLYELENVDKGAQARHKPDEGIIHDFSGSKNGKETPDQKAIDAYKKIANIEPNDTLYHVQEIMITDPISILNTSSVQDAYDLLKEKKISQIPIITPDGKIVSMINKKIILNMILDDISYAKQIMKRKLNEIEYPTIITTDPISDIRRVSKVMIDFKLDAVPVVDQFDLLVGIVSKTDIIKAVSNKPHFRLWV